MKATLEFELPQDESAYRVAVDAQLYLSCMQDLDDWLRSAVKHGSDERVRYQEVKDKLWELLTEYRIDLWAVD